MGLFICKKCGCIENTAVSRYWSVVNNIFPIEYDTSLEQYQGEPLCSECGKLTFDEKGDNPKMIPGKWHGKFPKSPATEEDRRRANKNGLIL